MIDAPDRGRAGGRGPRSRAAALCGGALLLLGLGLAAALAPAPREDPGGGRETLGLDRAGAAAAPPVLGPVARARAVEEAPEPLRERAAGAAPEAPDAPEAEDRPLPAPGRVRLRPVDSITGAPPRQLQVRFLGESRFAESGEHERASLEEREGIVEEWLTAGEYQAVLLSRGSEPRIVGPFAVREGEVTDLGTIALMPGSASLGGVVRAGFLPADRLIRVELRGDGRRPCAERLAPPPADEDAAGDDSATSAAAAESRSHWDLDEPCPGCGFAAASSVALVRPGELFRFPGLASGDYALFASDPDLQPVGVQRHVRLRPGQSAFVELPLEATSTLAFRVQDEQGRPVTMEIDPLGERVPATLYFHFSRGGEEIAVVEIPPSLIIDSESSRVRVQFNTVLSRVIEFYPREQLAAGRMLVMRGEMLNFLDGVSLSIESSEESSWTRVEEPPRLDRPRVPDDALVPAAQPTAFDTPHWNGGGQGDGLFLIAKVPATTLDVKAVMGDRQSDLVRVVVPAQGAAPVLLVLRQVDSPPESEPVPSGEFRIEILRPGR